MENNNIHISGDARVWQISFNKKDLFNKTILNSVYLSERKDIIGNSQILQDDDFAIFEQNLSLSLSELILLLAKRIDNNIDVRDNMNVGINIKDDIINISLIVGDNHDENLLWSLKNYCEDFLIKNVLESWYKVDYGSNKAAYNISRCLLYRKRSPAQKVRNIL